MNKLKQLEEKYKELGVEIEALKQADKPWPQIKDVYWGVVSDGDASCWKWYNSSVDKARLARGNCFRTKEQAEKKAEFDLVLAEVYVWVAKNSNEHPISVLNGVLDYLDNPDDICFTGLFSHLGDRLSILNEWRGEQ